MYAKFQLDWHMCLCFIACLWESLQQIWFNYLRATLVCLLSSCQYIYGVAYQLFGGVQHTTVRLDNQTDQTFTTPWGELKQAELDIVFGA